MTVEEENISLEEPISSAMNASPVAQARPWGYLLVGMIVTLFAVALGAVFGYLARPVFDPTYTVAIAPAAPVETLNVAVPKSTTAEETTAQSDIETAVDTTPQPDPPANTQAAVVGPPEPPDPDAPPTPTIMDFLLSDARHIEGDVDAPVTIIEFSDFACPYCSRFSVDTLPQLREAYIETGKVRFVYKHYAILGQVSIRAAEASECAAEQDQFWAYHDQIFIQQGALRSTPGDAVLLSLAEEVGLDMATFEECLNAGRYTVEIQQAAGTIQSLGVRGTPGFVINGVYIAGAQPYTAFQEVIERQLAQLDEVETSEQ